MLQCTGTSNSDKNYLQVCGLSMSLKHFAVLESQEKLRSCRAEPGTPGTAARTCMLRDALGRSREQPMPDSSRTGTCVASTQPTQLLSYLQMGFWRSQSPTARSQSWKETSESLSIHPTMFSCLLMEGTVRLCQPQLAAYVSD